MKPTIFKRMLRVLAVGALAVAIGSLGVEAATRLVQKGDGDGVDDREKVVQALRTGGIRAAARLKGRYVATEPGRSSMAYTTEALVRRSTLILVGEPTDNHSELSPDGRRITTDYTVLVRSALKGDLAEAATLAVSLPGGYMEFEDGTSADVRTPGFPKMVNGGQYVLFLVESTSRPGVWIPLGGGQGVFEIADEGRVVRSYARRADPVKKELGTKNVGAFVEVLRDLIRKWPGTQGCCS